MGLMGGGDGDGSCGGGSCGGGGGASSVRVAWCLILD